MATVGNVNPVKVKPPLMTGLIYSFVFMAVCTIILSLMLWLSDFREHSLSTAAYVIHGASVLTGGFAAGRHSLRKGWMNGGLVGLFYAGIIILVGFLGFNAGFSLQTLLLTGLCLVAASAGGILGVNTRK